jgi:type VI secretion system (T6SS) baseplate-like injector VgrG
MKDAILKTIRKYYPELESNRLFPVPGIVTKVPDPPSQEAAVSTPQRPQYAVNIKLLTPKFEYDENMPELLDVPVAMSGAGNQRGFAALPQPKTMVLVSFIGGSLSKPIVIAVLPHFLALPQISAEAERWQQSAASFQEVDPDGNWKRKTSGSISDQAQNIDLEGSAEITAKAPQIYIGNGTDNALVLNSGHMAAIIAALDTIANHTHNPDGTVAQAAAITTQKIAIQALKVKLDAFAKT